MFQHVVQKARLISLPDIYVRLKALMDDPEYTMAEVALLVGRDPALAARFLRFVNNPLNRRINKITSISHAVSMLGSQQIHDIVLSVSVTKAFHDIPSQLVDMKKFWARSCSCAVLLKELAMKEDIPGSDRLFVIGLLHDIGHLLMYTTIPDEVQQSLQEARRLDRPLYLVERDILGFDYAAVGGYMMRQWHLPESFQAIISCHPEPGKATQWPLETALLHLSSRLVTAEVWNATFGEGVLAVDPSVWQTTGLTPEQCLEYRKASAENFNEIAESIFA